MTTEFLKAFVQSMSLNPITSEQLCSISDGQKYLDTRFLQVTETKHSYLLEIVHLVESLPDRIRVESGFFDGKPNITTYRKSNARKFGQSAKSQPTLFEFDYEKFAEFDIMLKSLEIVRKCQTLTTVSSNSLELQDVCKQIAEMIHDVVPRKYQQLNTQSNMDVWQRLGATLFELFGKDLNQYVKVQTKPVTESQINIILDHARNIAHLTVSHTSSQSHEQTTRIINQHMEHIAHTLYQIFPYGTLSGEEPVRTHWLWSWLANN
jgi:hypothetical protein